MQVHMKIQTQIILKHLKYTQIKYLKIYRPNLISRLPKDLTKKAFILKFQELRWCDTYGKTDQSTNRINRREDLKHFDPSICLLS